MTTPTPPAYSGGGQPALANPLLSYFKRVVFKRVVFENFANFQGRARRAEY
jgi:hypothetical protein